MGYMVHHAIVVTVYPAKLARTVRNHCAKIAKSYANACAVSLVTPATVNDLSSFFVAPDGSKSGWKESEYGDWIRHEIIAYLDSFKKKPSLVHCQYAEIQFADDGGDNRLLRQG